jgi:hypothetical protein
VPRRALVLFLATVAVAAVVVLLLARGGGGGSATGVADPLAEALGYAPASSQVVAALDVGPDSQQGQALADLGQTSPLARFAGEEVRSSLRLLGLDPDADIPSVVGGPLVVAGPASSLRGLGSAVRGFDLDLTAVLRTGAVAAIVGRSADDVDAVLDRAVEDGRLRELPAGGARNGMRLLALPQSAGVVGVRDADLVLGADAAAVTRAIALRDRRGGLTRAVFEQRLGPLRGPALVRIAAQPRALIGDHVRGVPFVDALRNGAVALRLEEPGVRLRVHLATDPTRLRPDQLPLAPGGQPPSPAPGLADASAGIRDLSQTIDVLDQASGKVDLPFLASAQRAIATFDRVKGPLRVFGRIDADAALLDQLTGTTTITREGRGIVLRAELRDGGPLRTALGRIAAIPDFLVDAANITNLDLDRSGDDAFLLKQDGRPLLRVAVLGTTLVASTDVSIGLRAVAARAPQRVDRPGALAFHAGAGAIQDELVRRLGLPGLARLFLGAIGDLNGSVRSEVGGTDLDATLALTE